MARRVSCPTLIGRTAELARLDAALAQARDGSSVLLFVSGDAGIGKSRLVETFTARARENDAIVFSGACLDLAEGAAPYAPFVAALRPLADELSGDELAHVLGEARQELGALLPELCGSPTSRRDRTERGRLYELALGLFRRMAALRPAVLVLEDLHWTDPASADLLAMLGANLRHAGLVIIGTYRSDEVPRDHPLHNIVLELERSGRAERVELTGLSVDEVTAQVTGILGTEPATRQTRSLFDRSDGNPFFVEELLAAGPTSTGLTASLRDVLLTRVERLAPATKQVLRAVAIIGRGGDEELIGTVTELPAGELEAALQEAVSHRLLVVTGDGYDVRHALLREALQADLLPGRRNRLHLAVAEALADKNVPAESARHWHAAGHRPQALAGFVAAAVDAQTSNAWAVALAHYERALRLWPDVADAESRCGLDHAELQRCAAEVAMAEGEIDRALHLTEASMAELDAGAEPLRAAALRILAGRIHWVAGDVAAACRSYDEAVALLPAEASTRERAQVRALQGHAFMLQNRYTDAAACCREAIAVAVAVGAPDLEVHARNTLGVALAMLGEAPQGLEELAAALRLAKSRGDTWELGRTYVNFSDALLWAGRWAEAAEVGMEGVHVCRGLGYGRTTCMCAAGNTLGALVRLGRWPDADRLVDEVSDIDAPPGQRWGVTLAMTELALRRGDVQGARARLSSVEEIAARSQNRELVTSFHVCAAWLATAEGDNEACRERVRVGLDLIRGSEYLRLGPELCAIGLAAEASLGGDPGPLLKECREFLAGMIACPEPEAYGRTAEAESTRLTTPDPLAWADARAAWEDLGEPYHAAYCRFRGAEALLATKGSREEAATLLRAAHETVVALGADSLRRKIEDLSRRGRLELVRAGETVPGLTAREGEILALLSDGRTNRQIAEALFISERTVGVHVSRILHKLGVPNRGAAAHLFRVSE
ncbi:helix-turn-helix transcriptional regulator [Actinoallomurus iriomotensis]|uniref:Helix-turn-helix transcriptional regulator n=1 Tax=Actinoallomurus iriomotensis TaxID=478107 RepID=A0A9W6RM90_9ACTN|nr:AAA family ATPase [Actinoallomurus iriomotensis]GLY78089.1 helix-turn-helix transcriptional regulator [Actinoallomurus iriomotensis]